MSARAAARCARRRSCGSSTTAGTPWWRPRAARRSIRCGTTTCARIPWSNCRTAPTSRIPGLARSAARSARNGGSGRSPRTRRTRSTSSGPRGRSRCSSWSRPAKADAAPRGPGEAASVGHHGSAVDGPYAGNDRLDDVHPDRPGVRAGLEGERGERRAALAGRVDAQVRGRVNRVASGFGGDHRVVVGQQRMRGRAGRDVHDVRAAQAAPLCRAAQLVPVAVQCGDTRVAEQVARVVAQVGELKRVVDRAGRAVTLADREPDAEVAGGAPGDKGRRRGRRARRGRRVRGGGDGQAGDGRGGDRDRAAAGDAQGGGDELHVNQSFRATDPWCAGSFCVLRLRCLAFGWGHTSAVTGRAELIRRAQAHGVAVSYQNWRGRAGEVSDETLAAVLDVLGNGQADQAAAGYEERGATAPWPRARSWGFAVQLYSVRSRGSWGHGDLRDLADLAAWSAPARGAALVLVNPLHAAEPVAPISPSPYLAMT